VAVCIFLKHVHCFVLPVEARQHVCEWLCSRCTVVVMGCCRPKCSVWSQLVRAVMGCTDQGCQSVQCMSIGGITMQLSCVGWFCHDMLSLNMVLVRRSSMLVSHIFLVVCHK
jgi:hypothetical protein